MTRIGFIGSGGYGRAHIDGFLAMQAHGLLKITALADPVPAVLDALQLHPELRGARFFSSHQDLLADGDIDAVVISAPIPLHHEITLAALKRRLFILLEKPPAPLVSQLEQLISADSEGRVMVAFQHIYSDLVQGLKRDLVSGRAGRLLTISAHGLWPRPTSYYQRAGWAGQLEWHGQPVLDGPCTNAMAHYVNIVLYLAGGDLETFATPQRIMGEAYRARPGLPSYDTGCVAGYFESGSRFFAGFSHAASERLPVEINIRTTNEMLSLVDDCLALRAGGGSLACGTDGRENLWRAFLAFASGDQSQNRTPLQSMRAYVLATNLMFLSSGGIHGIPSEYVHSIHPQTDRAIFEVENIASVLRQSAGHVLPFCKAPAPWARKPFPIASKCFSEARLVQALRLSHPGSNDRPDQMVENVNI